MPEAETLVWPRPRQMALTSERLSLARPLRIETRGEADWLAAEAANAAALLNRAAGRRVVSAGGGTGGPVLTLTSADALPGRRGVRAVRKAEGYALCVTSRGVVLAGADAAGAFYAAQTLAQLIEPGRPPLLRGAVVRDWPKYPMRGAHCYLPPRGQLAFFGRFLDFLARLKCSVLFLEIGGGMEYERRPEINAAWRRFCRDALAYRPDSDPMPQSLGSAGIRRRMGQDGSCLHHPTGPVAMQVHRCFYKNSPHTELAGGGCLSKDECRAIVAECRRRHIEVIPEVQSFSHSYYLCCAHPEIAERRDDPFPDTYCPSNPRTYEILFDVMEEVVEVFQPRLVHCGHDELYTIRVCPRCRRRTGHDLLAGDISRIHAFLAARGVRMAMWGDKLMNFRWASGRWGPVCGLAGRRADEASGQSWSQPATWKAIDRIPKDILILDWYWSLNDASERYFRDHGLEVCYGNFDALRMAGFARRADPRFVLGAESSSWCEVSAPALGHNGVFHGLFPAADVLWTGRQMKRRDVCDVMARRLPAMIDELTGEGRWLVRGEGGELTCLSIGGSAWPLRSQCRARDIRASGRAATVLGTGRFQLIIEGPGPCLAAIELYRGRLRAGPIPVGLRARKLLVLHATTMKGVYFRPTFYSFHRGPAELLRYTIEYADGRRARFAAIYGEDIGPLEGRWPSSAEGRCYRAAPVAVDDAHTLYAQEWTNPRPEVPIAAITAALGPDATDEGEVLVAAITVVE
jgi:hypothetical protein